MQGNEEENAVLRKYVLVPRKPTKQMAKAGKSEIGGGSTFTETERYETAVAVYRAMLDAAPAPNPSPAAKGGDAGALRKHARNLHSLAANYGSHSSTAVVASAAAFAVENFLDALSKAEGRSLSSASGQEGGEA